jgi:hypothetical protein
MHTIDIYHYIDDTVTIVRTSVADPGSGAFLPPGSGIRIRPLF